MLSVLARAGRTGAGLGHRGFAVVAVDSVEHFATAVKEDSKAVAYFPAS